MNRMRGTVLKERKRKRMIENFQFKNVYKKIRKKSTQT